VRLRSYSATYLICALTLALFPSVAQGNPLTNPSVSCSTTCVIDFPYVSPSYYQWITPRAGTYTFELWGAQGGGGVNFFGAGGAGGYVRGDINLQSGVSLFIYLGQSGIRHNSGSTTAFNGGGAGNPSDGFSGGGATHIATSAGVLSTKSSDTSSVLAVAGGGGGGAGSSSNYGAGFTPTGGVGGGLTGGSPLDSTQSNIRGKGSGGSQVAGGATGLANEAGYDAPLVPSGFGLGASVNAYQGDAIQGGGGGGGWFGGGAGSHRGGSGGGGSSYVARLSSVTNSPGNVIIPAPQGGTSTGRIGSGFVRITYAPATPVEFIGYSFSGVVQKGIPVTITANVNVPSSVSFLTLGKRIPSCIRILTTGSGPYQATCRWRPATRGQVGLSFVISPIDSGSSAISTTRFSVNSGGRINRR